MKIVCPHCDGKGEVDLPAEYKAVLDLLPTSVLPISNGMIAAEVLEGLDDVISVTAVSNRLRRLFEMGFLYRLRRGRHWHYSKKPNKS